jgi:hypothetical protein
MILHESGDDSIHVHRRKGVLYMNPYTLQVNDRSLQMFKLLHRRL